MILRVFGWTLCSFILRLRTTRSSEAHLEDMFQGPYPCLVLQLSAASAEVSATEILPKSKSKVGQCSEERQNERKHCLLLGAQSLYPKMCEPLIGPVLFYPCDFSPAVLVGRSYESNVHICVAVCCSVLQCVAVCCNESNVHICAYIYVSVPHSHVWYDWHDSFMSLITHSHVWHDCKLCVTWRIHMCGMTHSHVWHDSFVCVIWLFHMCDMTCLRAWHDTLSCVTWLLEIDEYVMAHHTH
jgi:hypothetical protein